MQGLRSAWLQDMVEWGWDIRRYMYRWEVQPMGEVGVSAMLQVEGINF